MLKNKSNSTQRDGLVSRFKHYYRQIKNWVIHKPQLPGEIEKQMSMKAKISLSILAALILFAPMVSLSLHYLNSMWNRIQEIAVKDARLVDITQEIEVYMLLARRAESHLTLNAVPENDSIYIEQNTSATQEVLRLVKQGLKELDRKDSILIQIKKQTLNYQLHFTKFIAQREPPQSSDDHKQLSSDVVTRQKNELLQDYSELINQAIHEENPDRTDSLVTAANDLLSRLSLGDLLLRTESDKNPELAALKLELRRTAENILALSNQLGERGRQQLQRHRQETEVYTARAKRNIITILLLTFLISVYLIFVFPARIVRPISVITNIIRRAEGGDYDVTIPFITQDEIGELASFFNRMMQQVKKYDRLKTEKIAQQQKKVEAIANAVREGVLILNHEKEIAVINKTLQEKLGWNHDCLNKNIADVDSQGELSKIVEALGGMQTNVLDKKVKLKNSQNESTFWHVRLTVLRKENGNVFATIIVFKPSMKQHHKKQMKRSNGQPV